MSRPAAAVHRVIKAYDVRGLVGEELDEAFVADVGGAFARLVRDGASPSGDRLRHAGQLAVAGGGVRRRRHGAGPRRGADRAGVDRSAVFRVGAVGLSGRHVHRQPQPGRLQRHQAVPRRRQARRQGHRADRDQRGRHRRRACLRRAARHDLRPRRAGRLRRVPAVAGQFGRAAPVARRGRRRQRHGGLHHACGAWRDPVDHAAAVVLRTRRHVPQSRGQPAGPGESRRPAGATWSRRAPTSDWRSTATPTGVSSSTKRGIRFPRPR